MSRTARNLIFSVIAGIVWCSSVVDAQTTQRSSEAVDSANRNVPSLKQIMADPSWFARSPELVGWLPGSDAILYDQRREGVVERETDDRFLLTLNGLNPTGFPSMLEEVQRPILIPANGVYSNDRSRHLTSRGGDLFMHEDGQWNQLTRTGSRESAPMFMVGDNRIAFRRGDWMIRDLDTGLESEVADIRFAEDPAKAKDKDLGDLEQQQRDLFQVIRENKERDELNETVNRSRRDNDPTSVAGPFYLDKSMRSFGEWLSPSGNHLLLAIAKKNPKSGINDLMPSYVTETGYVTTSSVRPKVGYQPERADSFVLLDLRDESIIELGIESLPTISKDPLAGIKAAAKARLAESEATGDAEGESGESESDPEENTTPRPVSTIGVRWSDTGETVAVMLRSHDNKDRWIATVDTNANEPAFVNAHHLHDAAWINWSFNEFGFIPDTDTLWFLSEHTGFSHLYTLRRNQPEPSAITSGEYETRSIYAFYDNSGFLARTNEGDPGVHELERIAMDGRRTKLTQLGGDVQAYRVSPDETRAIVTYSAAMDPPELAAVSITGLERPVRLTKTDTDLFRSFDFTEPDFVWIPSAHVDRPIYTRVYRPDPRRFPGPRPIVIFSHGAGYLQFVQNSWKYYFREHMFHTLLTERGIIVLAPDFRASAGYGRDWRTAIYRVMGYPELEDFDDCIAWAATKGIGDPEKVGVYGGSYGGFMTLMAMFLRPDVYDAGAALRSVTDWRHYNHGYTSNILDTPDIDPEPFDLSSPITHAEGLKGKLLMCHGLLDDNVVAQDVIRLSQRLIELEKTAWELTLYPVEPHGFREPSSWHDEYRRILELFEDTLLD
ncbi:MAG: prolyl oligopeptidase family serine peptidase [Phycisphaerales bacterium]